ncbi:MULTISPECIES: pyrroline-5-carboxylate reductase [Clostridium]|uniref:pyrroline-5-carboxylate reductase n=1 Tax=Clostridium TaxID=1485 RepID=UPI000825F1CB|nr:MULTISPECIES: pyrroline-5-carboxylate reductase [Clostridium]PJI07599.1 pyrroline-5-carboxylate reductase [Clostridium sp. CT7]
MLDKKIAFIGGGNMAEGIIGGIISDESFEPKNVIVYDILDERKKYLSSTYGIATAENAVSVVKEADIVVIAVLPQDVKKASEDIKDKISENAIIISICAGINIDKLQNIFGEKHKIVRIIPNTMIEAKHGYSAASLNGKITDSDKKVIETILNSIGKTMFIDEKFINAFTAYSCAGPAYVMYFISALIDAGVESGLSRKDSTAIALENLIASALTIEKTGKHPYEVTDRMNSPAGITISATHVFFETGFHGIVMSAVKKALERTNELGKSIS